MSYGYDSLGRTTSVRYEDGAQVDYTYDNNGNLGLLTDSASGRKTQYFYDFQDRLMRWEQSGSGYANIVYQEAVGLVQWRLGSRMNGV